MHKLLSAKIDLWKIVKGCLCIILLLFTAGCGQIVNVYSEEEGTDMSLKRAALEIQKPPIDSRVPEKLETATFALG